MSRSRKPVTVACLGRTMSNAVAEPEPPARTSKPRSPKCNKVPSTSPVVSIELRAWGTGTRYYVMHEDGTATWLSRVSTFLSELNKHALYRWHSEQTANYWRANLRPDEPVMLFEIEEHYRYSLEEPRRLRDEAAATGTAVHQHIEDYLRTGLWPDTTDLDPRVAHGLAAWRRLWDSTGLQPCAPGMFVELRVYSLIWEYAGTLDLLVLRDGRSILWDWKTGSGIYPEMAWQMAAYGLALMEMGYGLPDACYIIHIPKNLDVPECEWACVWDTPEQCKQMIVGWQFFLQALKHKPGSLKCLPAAEFPVRAVA